MFPLLRYFSMTSAGAIIAVTAILAYFQWAHSNEDLLTIAGQSDHSLKNAFDTIIWPNLSDHARAVEEDRVAPTEDDLVIKTIDPAVRLMISGLPILKVNILTRSGVTIYSTESGRIGELKSNDPVFQDAIKARSSKTRTARPESTMAFGGLGAERTIVRTYMPVTLVDGSIEGVFEVYHDLTRESARITKDVVLTTVSIFAMLSLLYIVLFLIVRRANLLLQDQYELIEENKKRFSDFADASSDWLWETDASHRFTYMSPRVTDVTGVSVGFHIGKTREEIAGESINTPKWQELLAALDKHKEFKHFEYARTGPNGEIQHLNISGVPVFNSDGKFTRYRGIGNDVTVQNSALRRANDAENMLITAINALDDAFVIYDADDCLVLCNEKYRSYYPLSRDAIVTGATFEQVIRTGVERGEYAAAIGNEEAWIAERLERHRAADSEVEQHLLDGRWLKIAERKTDSGATVGFRVDVTELKHAQHAAEAANASKSEFLTSMSHEIRTPMTGVLGFVDMLLDDELSPESELKVKKIKEVAISLLVIINDILDISKLDAGRLQIETVNFSPAQIANDVTHLFYQTCPAEKKDKLQISAKLSDDFPDAVCADPTRLRQVLVNLMGNAVKFTDSGSVNLNCSQGAEADKLHFEVVDTGIGVGPDMQDQLFGEFIQADASISRLYQGTGLGLSICKRLVELMGGEIGIESSVGSGSRFWFTLPYEPVDEGIVIIKEDHANIKRFTGSRKLSILVAEDNDINQTIIEAILKKMGHQVSFADNGAEALAAVKANDFDLILMDVRMPVMSGPDATREIRKLPEFKRMIPIIALTADVMAENKQSYFDAGMNDCVGKPINHDELAFAMNKVLGETVNMQIGSDET